MALALHCGGHTRRNRPVCILDIPLARPTLFIIVVSMVAGCGKVERIELISAIHARDAAHVRKMLADGTDPNRGLDDEPALHSAIAYGCADCAVALIEFGADVNASDAAGVTPLHRAASRGMPEFVELLIDAGADVNAVTATGWTPLHYAALEGAREAAEVLIEAGADVSRRTDKGYTAAEGAAKEGYDDFAAWLREQAIK